MSLSIHCFLANDPKAEELDAEFQALTKEEPIVDESISPEPIFAFPLSSWAYHHKLHQMEWIIQLGFELDVYQADELAGMYWYTFHWVFSRISSSSNVQVSTTHHPNTNRPS